MGKWTHLRGEIMALEREQPPMDFDSAISVVVDSASQAKIQSAIMPILSLAREQGVSGLVELLKDVRALRDNISKAAKAVNLMHDEIQYEVIRHMEANKVEQVKTLGLTISRSDEPHPVVTDRAELVEYAKKPNSPLTLAVQWGTLKTEVKRALEENEELPPGCAVFLKEGLSVRKAS